ncbi:MAG: hypothetical protein JXX14_17310, partial [Deltaproteobacteria bacterium]|nr:hypothetical protein [Deltaproteobacteria bacterium]
PGNDDLTSVELAEMYQQCVDRVASTCGDEVPVPAEVCSPESLKMCTDWYLYMTALEATCNDVWDDMAGSATIDDDQSVPYEGTTEPDVPPVSGQGDGSSSSDDTIIISGLYPMRGLADPADPWVVTACCEELDGDSRNVDMYQDIQVCTGNLTSTDCAAIFDCLAEAAESRQDIDYGENRVMNTADEESNTASDPLQGDGAGSSDGVRDLEGAADDADDIADDETSGSSKDSGCAITTPGQTGISLLSLLL